MKLIHFTLVFFLGSAPVFGRDNPKAKKNQDSSLLESFQSQLIFTSAFLVGGFVGFHYFFKFFPKKNDKELKEKKTPPGSDASSDHGEGKGDTCLETCKSSALENEQNALQKKDRIKELLISYSSLQLENLSLEERCRHVFTAIRSMYSLSSSVSILSLFTEVIVKLEERNKSITFNALQAFKEDSQEKADFVRRRQKVRDFCKAIGLFDLDAQENGNDLVFLEDLNIPYDRNGFIHYLFVSDENINAIFENARYFLQMRIASLEVAKMEFKDLQFMYSGFEDDISFLKQMHVTLVEMIPNRLNSFLFYEMVRDSLELSFALKNQFSELYEETLYGWRVGSHLYMAHEPSFVNLARVMLMSEFLPMSNDVRRFFELGKDEEIDFDQVLSLDPHYKKLKELKKEPSKKKKQEIELTLEQQKEIDESYLPDHLRKASRKKIIVKKVSLRKRGQQKSMELASSDSAGLEDSGTEEFEKAEVAEETFPVIVDEGEKRERLKNPHTLTGDQRQERKREKARKIIEGNSQSKAIQSSLPSRRERLDSILQSISHRHQQMFADIFAQQAPDRIYSAEDIVALAVDLQNSSNEVTGSVSFKLANALKRHQHPAHSSSDGDKLPRHYVEVLRGYFVLFGFYPQDWKPEGQVDRMVTSRGVLRQKI